MNRNTEASFVTNPRVLASVLTRASSEKRRILRTRAANQSALKALFVVFLYANIFIFIVIVIKTIVIIIIIISSSSSCCSGSSILKPTKLLFILSKLFLLQVCFNFF